jgi:hypothetical protein
MDLLQWNLNGFSTRLIDVQALIQYRNPAILCFQETHLRPAHTLNIHGFTPYRYDHQDGERANGGTAILVQDHIYSSAVNPSTTLQASVVHLTLPHLSFSTCNIYLPSAVPIDRTELSYLLSQLSSPFILLGDFNSKHILWGSPLSDDRSNIISDVCTGLDLILLNTGENMHLCLGSGTLSSLDLAFCSPSLAVHLEWSVLSDLHGSDY